MQLPIKLIILLSILFWTHQGMSWHLKIVGPLQVMNSFHAWQSAEGLSSIFGQCIVILTNCCVWASGQSYGTSQSLPQSLCQWNSLHAFKVCITFAMPVASSCHCVLIIFIPHVGGFHHTLVSFLCSPFSLSWHFLHSNFKHASAWHLCCVLQWHPPDDLVDCWYSLGPLPSSLAWLPSSFLPFVGFFVLPLFLQVWLYYHFAPSCAT